MKIEVGRVYVLINGKGAYNSRDPKDKPITVKVLGTEGIDVDVLGFYRDSEYPLSQFAVRGQLKPASEKQRVAFNREYFETLKRFKKEGRSVYWL